MDFLEKPPGLLATLAPTYQELFKDLIQNISIGFLGTDSHEKEEDAMFTQPGIPRTFQGSHTNIFLLDFLEKPPGLLATLAPTYQELFKDLIQNIYIGFLGTDSQEKEEDAMFTQPGIPRTFQGSHTNIVGILFLYKTSWYRFSEKISGRHVYTTRRFKNFLE